MTNGINDTGNGMEISTRQLCFILAFFVPVTKLIMLPSALAAIAENDLVFSAAFALLLQGAVVFALLYTIREKNTPLFSLVKERFGGVTARIISGMVGVYFLFSACLPIIEQSVYTRNVFYDSRPSGFVFYLFFFFSTYAAGKGFKALGRSADAAAPLFLLSFPLLIFMAFPSVEFERLLPVFGTPFSQILRGSAGVLCWCSDGAWLLGFMGHVRVEKRFLTKTMLSFTAGSLAVLLFLTVFYGVFSLLSVREFYAVSVIARYYNAMKTIGRVDYLFIYVLDVVQLFALVVPVVLSVQAFLPAFNLKTAAPAALAVNFVLALFTALASEHFLSVCEFFQTELFPVFLVFADVVPFFFAALAFWRKKKEVKKCA